jgi:hypothetical protein
MSDEKMNSKFLGLWRRALELPHLSQLSPDLVSTWAGQMNIHVLKVEEKRVGLFRPTPVVALHAKQGAALFPTISATNDSDWIESKKRLDGEDQLWEKVEWFAPLWVARGRSIELLKDIQHRPKEQALSRFEYHVSTIYTLPFQAVCVAQLMPQTRSLSAFAPLAREAYLAFYSGHRASSIAALIPVMEGAINVIAGSSAEQSVLDQINKIIDRACERAGNAHFGDTWIPREYRAKEFLYVQDERVFAFQSFRRWLRNSFFRNTGEYDGTTWLNRHLFAHGATVEWQNASNFKRLIVALTTLGVIESWHDQSNKVSLLFPEMNDDGKLLWQQALLQAQAQMAVKQIEQLAYREHGQLVPPMPTDNGVLLRKALLADQNIKELVRPLRDAGWSVDVGEPDEEALFLKNVASSGEARLRVALLSSCASDNKLYKELEKDSDVILYLGPPFKQAEYAYGIDVHVGPLAGWLPPIAPSKAV